MTADLHVEMLTPAGMELAHNEMARRYCWFEHVGVFDAFEDYRDRGIELRNPGMQPPDFVLQALGRDADKVVCLRPIDSFNTIPDRPGVQRIRMALSNADLPKTIGLDWSFGGVFQLAREICRTNPNWNRSHIFVEVAHQRGSLMSYLPIPASDLRVWAKGTSTYNPATWPLLINADRRVAQVF